MVPYFRLSLKCSFRTPTETCELVTAGVLFAPTVINLVVSNGIHGNARAMGVMIVQVVQRVEFLERHLSVASDRLINAPSHPSRFQ